MITPARVFAGAFGEHLAGLYLQVYGQREPGYSEVIRVVARLVIERLSFSDALYHNYEHTALVVLVGQDILRGLRLLREVMPADWLHLTHRRLVYSREWRSPLMFVPRYLGKTSSRTNVSMEHLIASI